MRAFHQLSNLFIVSPHEVLVRIASSGKNTSLRSAWILHLRGSGTCSRTQTISKHPYPATSMQNYLFISGLVLRVLSSYTPLDHSWVL